jgi:hypothetical protein
MSKAKSTLDWLSQPAINSLISPACLLEGDHTNPAWRAQVAAPASERARPMILKWIDGHLPTSIELACALAAQCLRLPVPSPALVLAPKSYLPGLPAASTGQLVLLIGSEYKTPDAFFAQALSRNPAAEELIWSKLCDSESGAKGAAWDELIANPDRHHQNALFDGVNWWLFDHDQALLESGTFCKNPLDQTQRSLMCNFSARCNVLAEQMVIRLRSQNNISAQPAQFDRHKAEMALLSTAASKWSHKHPKIQEIFSTTAILLTAIELRLPPLAQHISNRLAQPSSETLWN